MSQKKICWVIALLVLATIISGCSRFSPSTPTITPIPVTILLIEGDEEQLPDRLREPLLKEHPASPLTEIAAVPADAVLISREELFDPANREDLLKIIDSQKILLVYGASPTDIRQELKLNIPTTTTETTQYVVGAAFRSEKFILGGGVLVPKGKSEVDLLRDVREYVNLVKSTLQKAQ